MSGTGPCLPSDVVSRRALDLQEPPRQEVVREREDGHADDPADRAAPPACLTCSIRGTAEIRVIGRHCKTLLLLCVASVVLFYPALLALYLELRLSKAGIVPSKTSTAISLMSKSSRGPEV